jgi:hypothetical protein
MLIVVRCFAAIVAARAWSADILQDVTRAKHGCELESVTKVPNQWSIFYEVAKSDFYFKLMW